MRTSRRPSMRLRDVCVSRFTHHIQALPDRAGFLTLRRQERKAKRKLLSDCAALREAFPVKPGRPHITLTGSPPSPDRRIHLLQSRRVRIRTHRRAATPSAHEQLCDREQRLTSCLPPTFSYQYYTELVPSDPIKISYPVVVCCGCMDASCIFGSEFGQDGCIQYSTSF